MEQRDDVEMLGNAMNVLFAILAFLLCLGGGSYLGFWLGWFLSPPFFEIEPYYFAGYGFIIGLFLGLFFGIRFARKIWYARG